MKASKVLYFGSEIPWEAGSCECRCSWLCLLPPSTCWVFSRTVLAVWFTLVPDVGVVTSLSWQCLPAPGVPSGSAATLWCWHAFSAFRGVGLQPLLRCCAWHCLAMLQSQVWVCHFSIILRSKLHCTEALLSLIPPSLSGPWGEACDYPCSAIAHCGWAEVPSSKSCCKQNLLHQVPHELDSTSLFGCPQVRCKMRQSRTTVTPVGLSHCRQRAARCPHGIVPAVVPVSSGPGELLALSPGAWSRWHEWPVLFLVVRFRFHLAS